MNLYKYTLFLKVYLRVPEASAPIQGLTYRDDGLIQFERRSEYRKTLGLRYLDFKISRLSGRSPKVKLVLEPVYLTVNPRYPKGISASNSSAKVGV